MCTFMIFFWYIKIFKKCVFVLSLMFPMIFPYNLTIPQWESSTFKSSNHI